MRARGTVRRLNRETITPQPGQASPGSNAEDPTLMGEDGSSETITCVDCGGRCHLLTTWPPDDPPRPGDVLVYRCQDCLDRWDVVIPGDGPAS
jgi:hypothetical protein